MIENDWRSAVYKLFLLTMFLLGSFICYHADDTIAIDDVNSVQSPPLDAEVIVEFHDNPKKCNCEKAKTDDDLKHQQECTEQASKTLTKAFIDKSAAIKETQTDKAMEILTKNNQPGM